MTASIVRRLAKLEEHQAERPSPLGGASPAALQALEEILDGEEADFSPEIDAELVAIIPRWRAWKAGEPEGGR